MHFGGSTKGNIGSMTGGGKAIPRFSPARWGEAEVSRFAELTATSGQVKPTAKGNAGMVVGTTRASAIRAGVEALRQGGSALDAVCTTALAQIALSAGSTTSYAGIFFMVYHETKTARTFALDAGYNAPLAETDPLSIPSRPTPSGRTALVPGFMAGFEAAHQRFGRLPFGAQFEPAIHIAEEGFDVDPYLAWDIGFRSAVLSRSPETRSIFTREDGEFYQVGDRFRQLELAKTLRAVALEGAGHMYTGDWAQAFVNAVQEEGGKITLKDLEEYIPIWSEPLRTDYRGYEVCTTDGGVDVLEGLNLLELADPHSRYGHYTKSPEALFLLIQISRISQYISNYPEDQIGSLFPSLPFSARSRATKEHARLIWEELRSPGRLRELVGPPSALGGHSDGVLAVDADGNVAAIGHTINTGTWGTTGIFVGGISIPDSATHQQERIRKAGPGGRIRNEINPLIVLRDGKPVLASAAIGGGLHEATLQRLHNVIDFDMGLQEAMEQPIFHGPRWTDSSFEQFDAYTLIPPTGFSEQLIQGVQELGQPVILLDHKDRFESCGWWVGLSIHPETGERQGRANQTHNGWALAE